MIQIILNSVESWLGFMAVCFGVYILFVIALRRIQKEVENNELYGVGRVADIVEKIQKYEDKSYER